MKASAQATATDFDFEEDLADDDMGLVETVDVEIEYTGMRKLTFGEEVAKYGILTGIFGGGVAWSWWEGKREDREEEKRVKEEVERIEKWKAEFIDMDDVVSGLPDHLGLCASSGTCWPRGSMDMLARCSTRLSTPP